MACQAASVPLLMRYLISQLDKSELSLSHAGADQAGGGPDHAL